MAQAVRSSPPTPGVPSSRHNHSMWVSLCTKRGSVSGFLGVSSLFLTTNLTPPILHAHLIHFVSFHQPRWWYDRRGRPALLIFTNLPYRGFIVSHPSPRPCVGYKLRILYLTLIMKIFISDGHIDDNFWEKNLCHSRDSNHRSPVFRTGALTT